MCLSRPAGCPSRDRGHDNLQGEIDTFGVFSNDKPFPRLYPPEGGWVFPESPLITLMKIEVGIAADNLPMVWRQAVKDYINTKYYNPDPKMDMLAMQAIDNTLSLYQKY